MKITGAVMILASLPLLGWQWEQPSPLGAPPHVYPPPIEQPAAPPTYYGFVREKTVQDFCESALKREAKQREEGKPVMTDSKHLCPLVDK